MTEREEQRREQWEQRRNAKGYKRNLGLTDHVTDEMVQEAREMRYDGVPRNTIANKFGVVLFSLAERAWPSQQQHYLEWLLQQSLTR